MERVKVRAHDMVITQGDVGDKFYIVDQGTYVVTIGPDGNNSPEILKYEPQPNGGANPCFGELALLYSKPRGANVVARTDGLLWALDRKTFHAILARSSEAALVSALRGVHVFRGLSTSQLRRLASLLTEVSFEPGETVIREGDLDFTFFIIAEGRATVTKSAEDGKPPKVITDLGPGDCFGERSLLYNQPRGATVTAAASSTVDGEVKDLGLKCLQVSRPPLKKSWVRCRTCCPRTRSGDSTPS